MKWTSILAAAIAFALSPLALALEPGPGWVTAKDLEKAMAYAKEKNRPIAVLFAMRQTSCGLHNRSQRIFMSQPALEGMVRIVVYTDSIPAPLQSCMGTVEGSFDKIPELYILDSTGQLTGFVDYRQEYLVPEVASVAISIAKWQSKSKDQIEKADKAAKSGRFGSALGIVGKISREDANATSALARALGAADTSKPARIQTGTDAGEKDDGKEASKEDKDAARKKKKVDLDAEQAKETTTKSGRYFPELLETKRGEYEKLAQERIDQAQAALEAKDTTKVRTLLAPFAADKSDLPQYAVAIQMLEELKSAEQPEKSASPETAAKADAAAAE